MLIALGIVAVGRQDLETLRAHYAPLRATEQLKVRIDNLLRGTRGLARSVQLADDTADKLSENILKQLLLMLKVCDSIVRASFVHTKTNSLLLLPTSASPPTPCVATQEDPLTAADRYLDSVVKPFVANIVAERRKRVEAATAENAQLRPESTRRPRAARAAESGLWPVAAADATTAAPSNAAAALPVLMPRGGIEPRPLSRLVSDGQPLVLLHPGMATSKQIPSGGASAGRRPRAHGSAGGHPTLHTDDGFDDIGDMDDPDTNPPPLSLYADAAGVDMLDAGAVLGQHSGGGEEHAGGAAAEDQPDDDDDDAYMSVPKMASPVRQARQV